ncbi:MULTISPECIES: hypothetical protein [Methylobacterium]|uniref:Uncharacterized protein n=1 Tax=Methylobacterium brachiatum TaxID=269660 RepID=A0AAJ1TMV4_9HYPH|nr:MULTISPECIES: hypothetical protein [Methylobacterium]AYO84065.1 hypothetical protein EBB05_18535 [Methylobacterium brachiatum]EIZ83285.1 hypothetical protein WYO_4131 [Methylobacterium sp. GXF4]MCB4802989.1 hypothetical protein [Methylobacterium brachiatum]MDF2602135.1 hypothetical protein [Methylobacterium brachiatum]MDH2309026.1 hypothetical protein [Methylobacterium brachiatum]
MDSDLDPENCLPDGAHRRLRLIAESLGCPVGDFFGPPTIRTDLSATVELLRLWHAITNETDRATVLRCARDVAGSVNRAVERA